MTKLAFLPLLILLAVPVSAQEKLKQVWVTQTDSGEVVGGRIVELSRESMALLTQDNRRVEIPLDSVLRIETHGDSLKNGALIGAAIFGGLTWLSCASVEDSGVCLGYGAINVGLGALMGAGVDALIPGRTTIYSKPKAAAGKTASVGWTLRF